MTAKVNIPTVEKEIPKILIGVPILAWTHEFAQSFLELWTDLMTYQEKGRKFHVGYKFIYRKPVQMAEEELAQFAIDSGCSHLLLMDDDIYDVKAKDLLALLDADKDVIGGIMHTGGFPFAVCAFRRYDKKSKLVDQPILKGPARLYEIPPNQREGIQKVDLIPFAFTLIKTSVFSKIPKPWFECDNQAPTDSWFADKILGKKLEYYCHFGVWLNHRGITKDNMPLHFQLGLHENQKKAQSQIIRLTPDEMKKHEFYMSERLELAEKEHHKITVSKQKFYEKLKGTKIAKLVKP